MNGIILLLFFFIEKLLLKRICIEKMPVNIRESSLNTVTNYGLNLIKSINNNDKDMYFLNYL